MSKNEKLTDAKAFSEISDSIAKITQLQGAAQTAGANTTSILSDIISALRKLGSLLKENDLVPPKLADLKETEDKWRSMSNDQFSYLNNILVALGAGFVGFVLKEGNLKHLKLNLSTSTDWGLTLNVICFFFISVSIFTGLLCAYNRILYISHTATLNACKRTLLEEDPQLYGTIKDEIVRINDPVLCVWFHRPGYCSVRKSSGEKEDANTLFENIPKIRALVHLLGKWNWYFFKIQVFTFVPAFIFYCIALFF